MHGTFLVGQPVLGVERVPTPVDSETVKVLLRGWVERRKSRVAALSRLGGVARDEGFTDQHRPTEANFGRSTSSLGRGGRRAPGLGRWGAVRRGCEKKRKECILSVATSKADRGRAVWRGKGGLTRVPSIEATFGRN